jgi:hypothetical protein
VFWRLWRITDLGRESKRINCAQNYGSGVSTIVVAIQFFELVMSLHLHIDVIAVPVQPVQISPHVDSSGYEIAARKAGNLNVEVIGLDLRLQYVGKRKRKFCRRSIEMIGGIFIQHVAGQLSVLRRASAQAAFGA